jgi:hypothetical protein
MSDSAPLTVVVKSKKVLPCLFNHIFTLQLEHMTIYGDPTLRCRVRLQGGHKKVSERDHAPFIGNVPMIYFIESKYI